MTEIINPLANERLACRLRDMSPPILANWGRRWPESCRKLRHRRSISPSRFINRSTETAAPASRDTSRCAPDNGIPLFSFKPYLSVSKIFFRATRSFVLVHKNQSWRWKYRDLRRKAHLCYKVYTDEIFVKSFVKRNITCNKYLDVEKQKWACFKYLA